MIKKIIMATLMFGSAVMMAGVKTSDERKNDIQFENGLSLPAPIKKWDNAIPLGNGIMGGLLWGEKNKINLSLDRGDLWDERGNKNVYDSKRNFKTLVKSVKDKDSETWNKYFNNTYNGSKWTKIPGARLVITLPGDKSCKVFNLDFEQALGSVKFNDGSVLRAFFSATQPVALLKLPKGARFELIRPESINQLGYPDPVLQKGHHSISFTQKTAGALVYSFKVTWRDEKDYTLVVIAITTNKEAIDPLKLATLEIDKVLKQGWDRYLSPHLKWWHHFYTQSVVKIPNVRLQNHYNLVKYYYGSSSRATAAPMPLQGVWTADSGGLPPWKGDYHNDLNTQMTYIAWQAAGLFDSGFAYLNFYWDRLPQFRKYGKDFFGTKGAMVPGVMTLQGQAMGGWPQYAMSLTAGLWNGHAFYQYWKVSDDQEFLKTRAYPWLSEVASSVFSLMKLNGKYLELPLSSSPEWHSSSWSAYLKPQSNFDQALLIWSSDALIEMAKALKKSDDVRKWQDIRDKLAPLKIDEKSKTLLVQEGEGFDHSHRHFSHTLAIHPLGIINVEQSKSNREIVRNSVKQIVNNGSGAWVGYSFTWAASLAARAGLADDAERLLVDFERAFITRNGFHVNGDQTKSGLSGFTYRPFTLEGNFLFMDAIQEMYLQSWGARIRIFPTVPKDWRDCSYVDLRAEGGFKVSAKRSKGQTTWVQIRSRHDKEVTIRDPFNEKGYWNYPSIRHGEWLTFRVNPKKDLIGTL